MIADCVCGTSVEVKLDLNTNEAICQNENCGKVVAISSFMKTAMRANGDVVRDTKPKIPFGGMLSVCQKCSKEFSAELDRKTLKCHCPKCKTEFKLSQLFKERLIEYKIYVGESEKILKRDESIQRDDDVADVAPARTAKIEESDEGGDDIKKLFGDSKIEKPKVVNKMKERALAAKKLTKKPVIARVNVDSNGDPIGGQTIFHPEAEESDAQLTADLEGRKTPKPQKALKKTSKKVKNK